MARQADTRHRCRSAGPASPFDGAHDYEPPEHHGRERDERPSYGLEAAAALGVDPAPGLKTLIASVDGAARRGRGRGRSASWT